MNNKPHPIPQKEYIHVIRNTQLISVDLIVRYFDTTANRYKYLLGLRNNRPAKNTWFVPGCRIYKSMRIPEGIIFVAQEEYGLSSSFVQEHYPQLIGIYEHIYPDNFKNTEFGTHYVVFSYVMTLTEEEIMTLSLDKLRSQHQEIVWLTQDQIIKNNGEFPIHPYTLNYFTNHSLRNPVIPRILQLE